MKSDYMDPDSATLAYCVGSPKLRRVECSDFPRTVEGYLTLGNDFFHAGHAGFLSSQPVHREPRYLRKAPLVTRGDCVIYGDCRGTDYQVTLAYRNAARGQIGP